VESWRVGALKVEIEMGTNAKPRGHPTSGVRLVVKGRVHIKVVVSKRGKQAHIMSMSLTNKCRFTNVSEESLGLISCIYLDTVSHALISLYTPSVVLMELRPSYPNVCHRCPLNRLCVLFRLLQTVYSLS